MTPQPLHWTHVALLAEPIPGIGRLCIIRGLGSNHAYLSAPSPEERLTIETDRPDLLDEAAARDAVDALRAAEVAKAEAATALASVAVRERDLDAREEIQRQAWIERNGALTRRAEAIERDRTALATALQEAERRVAEADRARIAAESERAGVLAMFRAAGGAAA